MPAEERAKRYFADGAYLMRYSKGGVVLADIKRMPHGERNDWCQAFADLVREEQKPEPGSNSG